MPHQCKICEGETKPRHTVQNITYFYCPSCNFLQNYYWEERPGEAQAQVDANDIARADRWPAGEPETMRQATWYYMELSAFPPAWFSRQLHAALQQVPGYTAFSHAYLKRRLKKILEFGCGYGTGVLEMRKKDNVDIIGLDPFSPTDNPAIIRQTIHEAALPAESFDAIIAIETMEHIGDILPTFRELYRILRPGGVLLAQTRRLEDPNYIRDQEKWFYLKDPTTHVSIHSEKSFRKVAKRVGFRNVDFRNERMARLTK